MCYRRSLIKEGTIVRHFKRETVDPDSMNYLYRVLAVAVDTDTGEKLVIYKALYKTTGCNVFSRKMNEFMSEVDHEKYPDIKQKYRFERCR